MSIVRASTFACTRRASMYHYMQFSFIELYHTFLQAWNGFSILRHSHPDIYAQADASRAWGCAAVSTPEWFQRQWPIE